MNHAAEAVHAGLVPAHHEPWLVVLSVLISILAAYAARDLTDRMNEARGPPWLAWFAGAAMVDAVGIWSMHYTGKLALRLPSPVVFDWRMVVLSYVVAVIGCAAALMVVARRPLTPSRALAGGVCLGGIAISGLHYTSMAAMQVPLHQDYSPLLFTLSIVVGIVVSCEWLQLMATTGERGRRGALRRYVGPVIRGLANPAMHYTAMASVAFAAAAGQLRDLSHAVDIQSLGILGISIVPVIVLAVALLTSFVDRLQMQKALLNELFQQAPQAVALLSADARVVRVNREFTRLFGYSSEDAVGRRLGELIVPEERWDEERRNMDAVVHGRRVDTESVRRRKDGTTLHASITGVPVSLPGGLVEIYAIYRDVTERKLSEQALRQSEQSLRELLGQRARLSRDLHDHIVQAIYAVGLGLERLQRKAPKDMAASLEQSVSTLNQVIRDARKYIAGAQPPKPSEIQFRSELAKTIQGAAGADAPRFDIDVDSVAFEALADDQTENVLNITREALSNAIRHSRGDHIAVTLVIGDGAVRMQIADNGSGFDPSAAAHQGNGLQNMASRAREIGAKLDVVSTHQGTHIVIEIPMASPLSLRDSAHDRSG